MVKHLVIVDKKCDVSHLLGFEPSRIKFESQLENVITFKSRNASCTHMKCSFLCTLDYVKEKKCAQMAE